MTGTQTTIDLLDDVLADLSRVVGGITEEQLPDPTPCTDYDVGQLRHHVVAWLGNFAAGFADAEGQAPSASIDEAKPASDPAAAVRDAAQLLVSSARAGAAERPLKLGEAAMPGEMALSMILWEYQVHGWDLARATGQEWQPPDAAVEESLAFAPGMLTPDYQGEGKAFAPAVDVPGDPSALDRLVALSGRQPDWPHGR